MTNKKHTAKRMSKYREDIVLQEYNYVKLTMILDEFLLQNGYRIETVENSYVIDLKQENTPVNVSTNEIEAYELALARVCKNGSPSYEPFFYEREHINKLIDDRKKVI